MKKALIAAINSKYVHTGIAARSIALYAQKKGANCRFLECAQNEETMKIAHKILDYECDIVGLSCYIWNIQKTLEVADIVKKANPGCAVVLGGPEAAYRATQMMEYPFVDAVLQGEGEQPFWQMITEEIVPKGIVCAQKRMDMDNLPFAYNDQDLQQSGRIFYYESSRGCLHHCAYCLSAAEDKITYKSLDLVFGELGRFMQNGCKLVKFIDRTFNSDTKRAEQILEYILQHNKNTEFHFEIAGDRLSERFLQLVGQFDKDLLRLEVGLQSANEKTLAAVGRKCDVSMLEANLTRVITQTDAVVHLDLIAGLPHEDSGSFARSFNRAFALHPHELQLGFLKVLHGSPLQKMADSFGCKYSAWPPYEVIATDSMNAQDLGVLKDIETVLEHYYNSGSFGCSLPIILNRFDTPYDTFYQIAVHHKQRGWLGTPHHKRNLFDMLNDFAAQRNLDDQDFYTALLHDYVLALRGAAMPRWTEGLGVRKYPVTALLHRKIVLDQCRQYAALDENQRHKHAAALQVGDVVWCISFLDKKIVQISDEI